MPGALCDQVLTLLWVCERVIRWPTGVWKTEQSPITNKSPHQVPHPSASKVGWAPSGRSSPCWQSCFLGTLPGSVWCWWWWCARDHSSLQLVFLGCIRNKGLQCHGFTSDATTFCSHLSLACCPPHPSPPRTLLSST